MKCFAKKLMFLFCCCFYSALAILQMGNNCIHKSKALIAPWLWCNAQCTFLRLNAEFKKFIRYTMRLQKRPRHRWQLPLNDIKSRIILRLTILLLHVVVLQCLVATYTLTFNTFYEIKTKSSPKVRWCGALKHTISNEKKATTAKMEFRWTMIRQNALN